MSNNYKQDIKVDKYRLDDNWQEQAELYLDWGLAWIKAVSFRNHKKRKLLEVIAELDKKIREAPENYILLMGDRKITETQFSNTILLQPEYKEANLDYLNAEERASQLEIIKNAFYQRRDELDGLTQLVRMSYFSTIPTEASEARRQDQYESKMDEALDRIKERKDGDT